MLFRRIELQMTVWNNILIYMPPLSSNFLLSDFKRRQSITRECVFLDPNFGVEKRFPEVKEVQLA